MPKIDGLDSFEGPSFHTARWRDDVELEGKRVAIIGNGASCMQIAPLIKDQVESLAIFQRSNHWAAPFEQFRRPYPRPCASCCARTRSIKRGTGCVLVGHSTTGTIRRCKRTRTGNTATVRSTRPMTAIVVSSSVTSAMNSAIVRTCSMLSFRSIRPSAGQRLVSHVAQRERHLGDRQHHVRRRHLRAHRDR